jgi:EAL domain-containing protein (putative c-di-GMP-specific phosphodiesterase class I)
VTEPLRTIPVEPARELGAGLRSYAGKIDSIAEQLRENGALGLILVDAAKLASVEQGYGIEAFLKARDNLHKLILESCSDQLANEDCVVTGEIASGQILIFLFRPRANDVFYRETLGAIATALRRGFQQSGNKIVYPYQRDAPELPVGTSMIFHNPGIREERQVRHALKAAAGDADLNQQIEERDRAKDFVDLLLSEEITILYEPIVNVTTREGIGYEALVRGPWDSDVHSPVSLFQLAEKTDLVFELDCLCRRKALQCAKGLPPGKKLFLNCLPMAIHDPAFKGNVLRQTLEELRLRPEDVVFEISERESIENFAIFREARDYYGELGFNIALDDTGVAYGSLEAIMELSPDFIKVDLSLVRSIDTDPPRQEMLRALHTVALKLDAQVIAEGIETSEELATIQSLGIPLGQGYLFGRPGPLHRAT